MDLHEAIELAKDCLREKRSTLSYPQDANKRDDLARAIAKLEGVQSFMHAMKPTQPGESNA